MKDKLINTIRDLCKPTGFDAFDRRKIKKHYMHRPPTEENRGGRMTLREEIINILMTDNDWPWTPATADKILALVEGQRCEWKVNLTPC